MLMSEFMIEPYIRAWVRINSVKLSSEEFVEQFMALIITHNLKAGMIKDTIMIYQDNISNGNALILIQEVIKSLPCHDKPLFGLKASILIQTNQNDRAIEEALLYEGKYGEDGDSISTKLSAYLAKGYEENIEIIAELMQKIEEN